LRRVTSLVAVMATATLALAACSSSSSGGTSTTPSAAAPASSSAAPSDTAASAPVSNTASASAPAAGSVKVGLAYDIGGRGDKSFNDAAAAGLDKAVTDLKVEKKELEASAGEKDAQKEERLRLLAQGGYNPVIAIGFAYAGALKKVAADFPKTNFAIVDDASITAPNVTPLVFAENQGSFLVGVIAAQASKKGNVGYIGGVLTPLLQKFQAGFAAGAKAVNPAIKVQVKYLTQPPDFTGFNDPAKGKTVAQGMLDAGADVVYAAAGGSGSGAFQAVATAKALAIGVDSDQYLTAAPAVKSVIVTSMLKRVDVAVFNEIKSFVDGAPLTGVQTFDLKVDGVGYATSNDIVKPFTAKAEEFKAKIISGEITVPDKPTS
jgi:basic membrane protein A and related proteins